jgi:hypothetical protein
MEKMVKIEVKKSVQESGIQAEVIKVDSIQEIMDRGVMMTPALNIDGKSMAVGRAASVEEIKRDCGEIKQRLMEVELNRLTRLLGCARCGLSQSLKCVYPARELAELLTIHCKKSHLHDVFLR